MDEVFWDHFEHPESKFDGDTGVLARKHIKVDRIFHIGKESNKLEESDILGVDVDGYEIYDKDSGYLSERAKELVLNLTPIMSKKYDICRNELYSIQFKVKQGKPLNLRSKTTERIRTMLEALGMTS